MVHPRRARGAGIPCDLRPTSRCARGPRRSCPPPPAPTQAQPPSREDRTAEASIHDVREPEARWIAVGTPLRVDGGGSAGSCRSWATSQFVSVGRIARRTSSPICASRTRCVAAESTSHPGTAGRGNRGGFGIMDVLRAGRRTHRIHGSCFVKSSQEHGHLACQATQSHRRGANKASIYRRRRQVHCAIGPRYRHTERPPGRVLDHHGTPAFAIPDLADEGQWSPDQRVDRQGDGHPVDNLCLQAGILI